MAKESMKARERKRIRLSELHADKRDALRKAANEGDWDAMMALQKLPKNSMKIRVHNRCMLTGRPRGYMRQFGLSRVTFREMALAGKIPGVTKASW
ncbi:30S ribosomal protein S14 [Putridiphycobacter roseus]|uniref:Small ribosomal subunit protein uS14 n=1 Tax=Putridiphycobacter roseus TaxID=2219161 RepID=A0A2W1N458_9FLAO|nr:30S ribosomal protein S14 [Putridiphycobacter roseus]PZE18380.1 30S ribosomal protein S14 [Putridiphycobacter roseus]